MATPALDRSLLEWVLSQSPTVVVLAVVLWFYAKEKRASEKRLVDLLRDRKTDRDETLRMYGRLDAHLTRRDIFEHVDRQALQDVTDPANPKRRRTDRELLDAIATKQS